MNVRDALARGAAVCGHREAAHGVISRITPALLARNDRDAHAFLIAEQVFSAEQ